MEVIYRRSYVTDSLVPGETSDSDEGKDVVILGSFVRMDSSDDSDADGSVVVMSDLDDDSDLMEEQDLYVCPHCQSIQFQDSELCESCGKEMNEEGVDQERIFVCLTIGITIAEEIFSSQTTASARNSFALVEVPPEIAPNEKVKVRDEAALNPTRHLQVGCIAVSRQVWQEPYSGWRGVRHSHRRRRQQCRQGLGQRPR